LIPAFSIQRTQEILMILIEERLRSQENIDRIKELTRQKKLKEAQLAKLSTK
jgi:predicted metal-dependent RNase